MGFSLRNVVDIDATLARDSPRPPARRALRESRREQGAEPLFKRLFNLYFYGIVPLVGGLVGGSRRAYTYLPNSLTNYPDAPELPSASARRLFRCATCRLMGGSIAVHYGVKA